MITTRLADALAANRINVRRVIDTPTDIVLLFDALDDSLFRMHELTYPTTVTDFYEFSVVFPIADMDLVLAKLDF